MHRAAAVFTILVSSFCLGCRAIEVTTEYDPTASFEGFQTYAWAEAAVSQPETGPTEIINPILDARIRRAVEHQLSVQGYLKDDSGTPDFQIGYEAAVQQKVDASVIQDHYNYSSDWNGSFSQRYPYKGASFRTSRTEVYYYEEGTLILDISLPETRRLIWRGAAQAELNRSDSQEARDRRLAEAVRKLLEQFPPATRPAAP